MAVSCGRSAKIDATVSGLSSSDVVVKLLNINKFEVLDTVATDAAGKFSYKVAENEDFYAFLDIAPMAKGHTLVIPKNVEDDYIFNLDQETYMGLCAFARKVAQALKAAVPCKRVGVAVLGMEVPHTHIHLVPLQSEADMDFRKTKLELSQEEFAEIASAIYNEYVKIG